MVLKQMRNEALDMLVLWAASQDYSPVSGHTMPDPSGRACSGAASRGNSQPYRRAHAFCVCLVFCRRLKRF